MGKMESIMKRYNLMLLVIVIIVVGGLGAKYSKVSSTSKFYKYLEPEVKNQLALGVVLFYDKDEGALTKGEKYTKEERQKAHNYRSKVRKRIKEQLHMFESSSKAFKEVNFLAVDISSKDNEDLAEAYGIKYYPEMRLFKGGKVLKVEDKTVKLKGDFSQGIFIDEPQIVKFVQKFLGKDIDEIIKAKAAAEYELAKLRAAAPKYYNYGPYWGWGWGGYGWGGYGWGGYGWGGGYGWRGCC